MNSIEVQHRSNLLLSKVVPAANLDFRLFRIDWKFDEDVSQAQVVVI
jgi:hypothetical protein